MRSFRSDRPSELFPQKGRHHEDIFSRPKILACAKASSEYADSAAPFVVREGVDSGENAGISQPRCPLGREYDESLIIFSFSLCAAAGAAFIVLGVAGRPDPSTLDRVQKAYQEGHNDPFKDPTPTSVGAQEGLPPLAAHIPNGDLTDDAIAYSKQLIPFVKTHEVGRTSLSRTGVLCTLAIQAAQDCGHKTDAEKLYFQQTVFEKLAEAGIKLENVDYWQRKYFGVSFRELLE